MSATATAEQATGYEDEIDITKYRPDDVEEQMKAGALIPEGFYHATLDGAKPVTSKGDSPRPGWELTFKITSGPFKDRDLSDTLWKADPDKKAMVNRTLLFKHRLGLIKRNADGTAFEPVPGKKDFMDCLDTPIVIEVKHEAWENKDTKKSGVSVRLAFNGLHKVDDPEVLKKVGKPVPAAAPKAAAATATAPAKKKFDESEL